MKVLVLYSELAGYTVSCFRELIRQFPETHLTVIRWQVNSEAPFQFDFSGMTVCEKNDFRENELLTYVFELNPDIIICSGWMDKDYVKICKHFFGKIPTVLTLDNHWRGGIKQRIAQLASPFYIRTVFSHAWVPGSPQYQYARKLGFKVANIKTGFYSADVNLFSNYYEQFKSVGNYPKRFLYAGRYVAHKGIFDLWNAFAELQEEQPNEWELWCVGTGDQWENRLLHPKVKHLGFLQPNELKSVIDETSWYILPSHFEPWGVSLQEFAVAGFPIICSNAVGAATQFVKENENGFVVPNGDKAALKNAMKKAIELSDSEFLKMRQLSHQMGQSITPHQWAATLYSFKR
jgi:glycosyltransferase involved in cell wall biosynthesis